MNSHHIGPEAPMYRLYRKMDGEIVLQHFVPVKIFDDLSATGYWATIPTINEEEHGED